MDRQDIEHALFRGVRLAIGRAFRWSGNHLWPGDTGAENLIQVSVADSLYRHRPENRPVIYLEPTLGRIAPGLEGDTRRVDIGLLRRAPRDEEEWEAFTTVVEIKKYPGDVSGDLQKICDILEHAPSVRHAFLVTYYQKHWDKGSSRDVLADRMVAATEAIEAQTAKSLVCHNAQGTVLSTLRSAHGRWEAAATVTRFSRAG